MPYALGCSPAPQALSSTPGFFPAPQALLCSPGSAMHPGLSPALRLFVWQDFLSSHLWSSKQLPRVPPQPLCSGRPRLVLAMRWHGAGRDGSTSRPTMAPSCPSSAGTSSRSWTAQTPTGGRGRSTGASASFPATTSTPSASELPPALRASGEDHDTPEDTLTIRGSLGCAVHGGLGGLL
uniref:Uncharacterized protein n=1 Tax=Accipiter nisus TaxID=211598 RepID=A0A8B9MAD3_9AVES